MKLLITNREHECGLDEQLLTVDEFNDITYHPYIQSIYWDIVYLDLDDSINRGFVKQILGRKSRVVPRIVKDIISPRDVLTLIEICPDYAAAFIKAQSSGQEELHKLFKQMSDLYIWS